jgi:TRAP-type C4-dicarboxylate transport system substrate-binding protein
MEAVMKTGWITALLALAWCALAPGSAMAEAVKIGTLAPKGSPWHEVLQDLSEEWKEASEGRYQFRIYPGGVAGDEPDMVRKMRIGQLHAAALSGIGLHRITPEIQALQIPMMYRNNGELDYVREKVAPRLEVAFSERGFKVLAWGDVGWVRFFSRRPVVHPDEMKPLKLFTSAGDTVVAEAYKDAGYQVVPLASTDIHTALQAGLIDAVQTTAVAALSFQWFALAPHMTSVRWAPLVGAIVVSDAFWRDVPADLQARFLELTRAAGQRLQDSIRALEHEAVEVMREHGLAVHDVPSDLLPVWEARAQLGYPRLVGPVVSRALVEEATFHRDAYRRANGE